MSTVSSSRTSHKATSDAEITVVCFKSLQCGQMAGFNPGGLLGYKRDGGVRRA